MKTAGKAAAEGAFLTCPCAPTAQVQNGAKFIADYKAAFNTDPGTYSTEGFDAASVILQAIKAGKFDRTGINDFLKTVDYQGITKKIKFDSKVRSPRRPCTSTRSRTAPSPASARSSSSKDPRASGDPAGSGGG